MHAPGIVREPNCDAGRKGKTDGEVNGDVRDVRDEGEAGSKLGEGEHGT
jgi:hypothetical protein